MIYLQLFLSFLQIGLFSFGGGYAAMPLIQDQVVTRYGWLSMAEFTDLITISQMTPEMIEGLFIADMEYLQSMYDTINKADKPQIQVTCPYCGKQFTDTLNFLGAG